MILNEYFISKYINESSSIDNEIFCNLSHELLSEIKQLYSNKNSSDSLQINIDKNIQNNYEKIIKETTNEIAKKVIAEYYITTLILQDLISKIPEPKQRYYNQEELTKLINLGINAYASKDFNEVKNYYFEAPNNNILNNIIKNNNINEIVIIIKDIDNNYLQNAINSHISSRTKHSYKVFTNQEKLCNYYDLTGNIIQSPHDYINQNINIYSNSNQSQTM